MSEKTEEATPKKLRKARKDGQVARSAEFSSTLVLMAASLALIGSFELLIERFAAYFATMIHVATSPDVSRHLTIALLWEGIEEFAWMMSPLLGIIMLTALVISYLQVGAVFSLKPILPDSKRLDMIKGFKNIVSKAKVVELIKNILKISVLGLIGYRVLRTQLSSILLTINADALAAAAVFWQLTIKLSLSLIGTMLGFAVFDLWWQRYKFHKEQRMAKHEVKREYKESEGDPQQKADRKHMHKELSQGAPINTVVNADALVVNPTHIAVALQYREKEMNAPKILTSARGELAKEMKRIAQKHDIPIVRNISLARSLIELKFDEEIPESLYEPVAEVLRFVYSLRKEE